MRCSECSSWSPGEVMSQDPAGAAVARVGGAGAVQVGGSGCRLCRAYPEEGPELGALLGPGAGGEGAAEGGLEWGGTWRLLRCSVCCHLHFWFWKAAARWKKVKVLVAQSCLTLCHSMDCIVHQASLSMGFSRQEYQPRAQALVSCTAGRFLPSEPWLPAKFLFPEKFPMQFCRSVNTHLLPKVRRSPSASGRWGSFSGAVRWDVGRRLALSVPLSLPSAFVVCRPCCSPLGREAIRAAHSH